MMKALLVVVLCLFLQNTLQQEFASWDNAVDFTMISGTWVTMDKGVNPDFEVAMMFYRKTVRVFACRQYDCLYSHGRVTNCTAALRTALLPIASQLYLQQLYGGSLIPTYCTRSWRSNLSGVNSSGNLTDQVVIDGLQNTLQAAPSPFYDNIFTTTTEDKTTEVRFVMTLPEDLPIPPKMPFK